MPVLNAVRGAKGRGQQGADRRGNAGKGAVDSKDASKDAGKDAGKGQSAGAASGVVSSGPAKAKDQGKGVEKVRRCASRWPLVDFRLRNVRFSSSPTTSKRPSPTHTGVCSMCALHLVPPRSNVFLLLLVKYVA